ncbi:hypothetical protein CEXT_626791 [Caerostris extrusa]|uniref:Uncharacterized protein n=1 Tax=Caerostris extrusa TaxID=172846 RepID=A0AAV4WXH3_CAEEX|nr:hypothetical protein CEXT_626791 [Caerostris extrusa]
MPSHSTHPEPPNPMHPFLDSESETHLRIQFKAWIVQRAKASTSFPRWGRERAEEKGASQMAAFYFAAAAAYRSPRLPGSLTPTEVTVVHARRFLFRGRLDSGLPLRSLCGESFHSNCSKIEVFSFFLFFLFCSPLLRETRYPFSTCHPTTNTYRSIPFRVRGCRRSVPPSYTLRDAWVETEISAVCCEETPPPALCFGIA